MEENETIRIILDGLTAFPKHISSMFLYDAAGSLLFEKITRLPEYYMTRYETALLRTMAQSLGQSLRNTDIVEFGSGNCSKVSILLDAAGAQKWKSISYIPIDVCPEMMENSADILTARYPGLFVHGIVADLSSHLQLVPQGRKGLFCFFGGTIGNLSSERRSRFFGDLGRIMKAGDMLLLGADMVKSKEILEGAYNDAQTVTAAFNRNILNVVNAAAGTDFDPEAFEHVAFFNERESRIEMHLKARRDMAVSCPYISSAVMVVKGEQIHTENSYKFTIDGIRGELESAGLIVDEHCMDPKGWVSLLKVTGNGQR